jgi:anti-sigma regulatory factor (Ser/Thr protein kinase)
MIDSLEQNEQDPDRLGSLFAMDHLVTRMRRNSENLLLLAGHEGARKWSEPVPIADVARAATSEIEQYQRVTLNVQPGVAVSGQAVTDLVHLLAELIENATTFSPADTQVRVSAQELNGGVLIEVNDGGVGISESRLAELNWRLDNPPVIDVSVSRHMGLFAVAHLAQRHGVRVRLRAESPRGLTALVWLPDSVIERGIRPYGRPARPVPAQASYQDRAVADRTVQSRALPDRAVQTRAVESRAVQSRAVESRPVLPASPAPARVATSPWFQASPSSATGTNGDNKPAEAEPQAASGGLAGTDAWADSRHAAEIVANPVRGDQTAAGLPVRVPRANLIPGSAGGAHRAGNGATSRPAESPAAQTFAAGRPERSPEMARSRLSGIQRGIRRAKDETPRAGEGANR